MKLRSDRALPKCTKSSTDSELPRRVMPYIETALPAMVRSDNELPTVK